MQNRQANNWEILRNSAAARPAQGATELYSLGVQSLAEGDIGEALLAFKGALFLRPDYPSYMSYAGLCMALSGYQPREALDLCQSAVRREFYRPELYLNLGRALLAVGNPRKAHKAFVQGLVLDREHAALGAELKRMGLRRRPILPFLGRRHVLNRWLGKLLRRQRLNVSAQPSAGRQRV